MSNRDNRESLKEILGTHKQIQKLLKELNNE